MGLLAQQGYDAALKQADVYAFFFGEGSFKNMNIQNISFCQIINTHMLIILEETKPNMSATLRERVYFVHHGWTFNTFAEGKLKVFSQINLLHILFSTSVSEQYRNKEITAAPLRCR